MLTQSFEIKVALLGHVSVGKTTLLNALLGDKFSEVSRKRTTAGVNFFHILTPSEKASVHWTESSNGLEEDRTQKSKDVLREITKDNEILRKQSNSIQERHFDVALDQPLIEMREDTSLTLVDVPGINEAHTKQMYLDYVKKAWTDLDCVIVVMDAQLGVNGEEQIDLLRFVKTNITDLKDVPIVVLCNKVDDPDDVEIQGIVEEVRHEVVRIFEGERGTATGIVGNSPPPAVAAPFSIGTDTKRKISAPASSTGSGSFLFGPKSTPASFSFGAPPAGGVFKVPAPATSPAARVTADFFGSPAPKLNPTKSNMTDASSESEKISSTEDQEKNAVDTTIPTFLPISAENAFLYRSAAQLLLEDSHTLDHAYLEKIGHEEIGKYKWKQLSDSEKRELVCGVVSDPVQYKERLKASNFDSFVHALNSCLGGKGNQMRIIEKQIEIELKGLASTSNGITSSLSRIYDRCIALGKKTDYLKEEFWSLINASKTRALCELGEDPTNVDSLHVPMNELIAYANSLHIMLHMSLGDQAKEAEEKRIIETMTTLVQRQIHIILEKEMEWRPLDRGNLDSSRNVTALTKWSQMTPRDWSTIISSILILSRNEHFYTRFGQETVDLEWLGRTGRFLSTADSPQYRQSEKGQYLNGKFVPDAPHLYARAVHLKVPATIEDPSHWGHLAWRFCKFMDSRPTSRN